MQKGFAPIYILVGILILAIVGGGAYFFGKSQVSKPQLQITAIPTPSAQVDVSPEPNGTGETVYTEQSRNANWKIYTNTKYGYSVKYPDNWKITREEYDEPVFKSLTQIDSNNPKTLSNITISVSPKSYNELLKGLEGSVKQYNGKSQNYNLDDKILNARRIEFVIGAGRSDYVVHVLFNDKSVFDIEANFSNPPDQEDVVLLDQILSTFRFD